MNKINNDAIAYGIIKHDDPQMIIAIKNTLVDGFTPEQIKNILVEKFSGKISPSHIMNIESAAKYILAEELL